MAVVMDEGLDTRSRILREAEHLFMEHGFAAISMSMICQACHLTKPGVYYHFEDKEDLYVQVVLGVMGRAREMLTAIALNDQLSFRQRVEATVRALVLIASQNMDQVRRDMVQHLKTDVQRQRLERSFFQDMMNPIQEMMVLAHQRGELDAVMQPAHAAKALLALTNSFADRTGPTVVANTEVPRLVTRILLEGFSAESAREPHTAEEGLDGTLQ